MRLVPLHTPAGNTPAGGILSSGELCCSIVPYPPSVACCTKNVFFPNQEQGCPLKDLRIVNDTENIRKNFIIFLLGGNKEKD